MSNICFLDKNGFVEKSYLFDSSDANNDGVVPISIYADDSIKNIKYKILKGVENPHCYEELYLFAIIEKPFVLLDWYKHITHNDTVTLRKNDFHQVLVNLSLPNDSSYNDQLFAIIEGDLGKKETITYEDLETHEWFKNREIIYHKVPLGNRIEVFFTPKYSRIVPYDPFFIANPYDVLTGKTSLDDWNHKKKISSLDDEFLFHFGNNFHKNTIYVCTAPNVLNENPSTLANFYFPFLHQAGIDTTLKFEERKNEMIDNTVNVIKHKQFSHFINEMDFYHGVSRENIEFPYNESGIESFLFYLENNQYFNQKVMMPLESIFKNIHASENIPYILFNKGYKQDPILRVHYNDTDIKNKKIPSLPSTTIKEMLKEKHGNGSYITMYLPLKEKDPIVLNDFINITLHANGNVEYKGTLLLPMPYLQFESYIVSISQSVFSYINEYLLQIGYHLRPFRTFLDSFVRIVKMDYVWLFNVNQKGIDFTKNIGVLSSLFYADNISDEGKNADYKFRYKRVEHFQTMDHEEEIIAQFIKLKDHSLVFQELRKYFTQYNDYQLKKKLDEYSAKYRTIKGRFRNRKVETLTSPGFPVTFTSATLGSTYTIRMKDIDMIEYILCIPKYMNSLLVASQFPEKITNEKWRKMWTTDTKTEKEFVFKAPDVIEQEDNTVYVAPEETNEKEEPDANVDGFDDGFDDSSEEEEDDEEDEEEPDNTVSPVKSALDFDSDSEEESSEEEKEKEKSPESKLSIGSLGSLGGAKKEKGGINTDNNFILERIQKRDNELFKAMEQLYELTGKGYTKTCQEDQKRQPIALTQEEKDKIDADFEGKEKPYTNALQYRTNEGNPLYYICPRYWCTKKGKEGPITKEQAEGGEYCGKIIKKLSKRGDNEYIYDRLYTSNNKSSTFPAPGFLDRKDPDRPCLPCCFSNWDTPKQMSNRQTCNAEKYGFDEGQKANEEKRVAKKIENNTYILDYNTKDTLSEGRHGILPVAIQRFLNIENNDCINKQLQNKTVKNNCPVFMRYGVENTTKNVQSFVACICDIFCSERKIPVLKLKEFKSNVLINAITLDTFVKAHNGSLVSQFQNKKSAITMENVDIHQYKDQTLYQKIDLNDESQVSFLKYSIVGYNIFRSYLIEDHVRIDHTFLWDFICQPNQQLFPKGLNLLIMEMTNDDITNKVHLVCPTSKYIQPLFDIKRPTVLLYKYRDVYEPIYRFTKTKQKEVVRIHYEKRFSAEEPVGNMQTLMNTIQNIVNQGCSPLTPQKSIHKISPSIHLSKLVDTMKSLNLEIVDQIINYQGKVIAVTVKFEKENMTVPCHPSTPLENLPLVWMGTNQSLNYHVTVSSLEKIYDLSNKVIPCKPMFRVAEDNMIVGILTITNQFVQINPPLQDMEIGDSLKTFKHKDYLMADKTLTNPNSESGPVQKETTHFLFLENQFFNAFRTTMRILMHLYKNRQVLKKIISICNRENLIHRKKREKVIPLLQRLSGDHIEFHEYAPDILNNLHHVVSCQNNTDEKAYCLTKASPNNQIVLLLPRTHLVTKTNNESFYFAKLADELVRYRKINKYMFHPEEFLNLGSQEYRINENEFLIPRSLLHDYFDDISTKQYGEYATNTTTDTTFDGYVDNQKWNP